MEVHRGLAEGVGAALVFLGVFSIGYGCGILTGIHWNASSQGLPAVPSLESQEGGVSGSGPGSDTRANRDVDQKLVCIAHRNDDLLDVKAAMHAACMRFDSELGFSEARLSCAPWFVAEGAAPPRSCSAGWDKADWVFSTLYQLSGFCDQGDINGLSPAVKTPAVLLEPADVPEAANPLCAKGWDGAGRYNTSQ